MFIKANNIIRYIEGDNISMDESLPIGIYQLLDSSNQGTYLETMKDFKLSHGKVYGTSQSRAEHIIEAYKIHPRNKNLGVLLSGGKGLGKTLTVRLIVEKLKDTYPVINVSSYFPRMIDFLSHIKNCIIVFDEFEKFMSGNIKSNDSEDEQTKQESILSLFDGNTGCEGNLLLLTVNNVAKLDENLISRPSRIRYNYRYNSESPDVVKSYCEDNLIDKSKLRDVLEILSSLPYLSIDIISTYIDEINNFPDVKVSDIKDYLNIRDDDYNLTLEFTFKINGKIYKIIDNIRKYQLPYNDWIYFKGSDRDELGIEAFNVMVDICDVQYSVNEFTPIDLSLVKIIDVKYDNKNTDISNLEIVSVGFRDQRINYYKGRFENVY